MQTHDLRSWLEEVERFGELRTLKGAHWDIEIGVLTEHLMRGRNQPAVLFDDIIDYPAGHRLVVNNMGSRRRLALTLGLPVELDERGLMDAWRRKRKSIAPVAPKVVADGPVMENVLEGERIDVRKFPAPKWHENDGGRYLGTGDAIITRDPDGSVNMGTYRVMVHDRNRIFVYISPGKDGRIHRDKWFARNEPMPVVVIVGAEPLLHMVGGWTLPHRLCELDYAGGIKGEPIEVIQGPVTGLPIPARAEIVIEGFVMPEERLPEGPFGEWTGYYGSRVREEPVVHVKAIYHRNSPIVMGSPPVKPPSGKAYTQAILRSAALLEELESAGVPDIKGVWMHEAGGAKLLIVLAITQRYPGHARQAALVASQARTAAYMGRYIVVVDEDIDPMDLEQVVWAICTRSDPSEDIDVVRRCWSGPLDPVISPQKRNARDFGTSRAIIDATRPYEWKGEFPVVSESGPELKERVLAKWQAELLG